MWHGMSCHRRIIAKLKAQAQMKDPPTRLCVITSAPQIDQRMGQAQGGDDARLDVVIVACLARNEVCVRPRMPVIDTCELVRRWKMR
jgi:hypothetical protein